MGSDDPGHDLGRQVSEARERGYLEAALDCVIMIDADGRVVEFNPAAERTFGYARAEAVGRAIADLIIPPSLRERHRQAFARFVDTRTQTIFATRIELVGMRADGTEFPVELTLSQVEGEPLLILGALRDLTQTKAAEARLRHLLDEQAALRRVALLVARGADSSQVFDAVCSEAGRLLGATQVRIHHETGGEPSHLVATWRATHEAAEVRIAEAAIMVDGRTWGTLTAQLPAPPRSVASADAPIAVFCDLLAIAISNAVAKEELLASRRRLVHAGDDARRKLGRDLHDGAQQRLVFALMSLQLAIEENEDGHVQSPELVLSAVAALRDGISDLRHLTAGLHPYVLTSRGLATAIEGLTSRHPTPVTVDVAPNRYPTRLEADAYFIVAEALTNAAKHANASRVDVVIGEHAGTMTVEIRDDGTGGVDTDGGTGLRGLHDRVNAIGGEFEVESAPGRGTRLRATLPIPSA